MSGFTLVQIPPETQYLDTQVFAQLSVEAMASRLLKLHRLHTYLKQQYMIKVETGEEAAHLEYEIKELRTKISAFDKILREKVERKQTGQVSGLEQGHERDGKEEDEVEDEGGDVKEQDEVKDEEADVKEEDKLKDDEPDVKKQDEVEDDEGLKNEPQNGRQSHDIGSKTISAPAIYPSATSNSSDQGEDPYLHLLRRSSRRNYFTLAFLLVLMSVCFLGLSLISIHTTSTHSPCRSWQHHAPGLLVSELYPNTSTPLPFVHDSLEDLVTQLRQAGVLPPVNNDDLTPQKQPLQLPPQLKKMLIPLSMRLAKHMQPELPLEHRLTQLALPYVKDYEKLPPCSVRDTGCSLFCYVSRWRRVCLGCLSTPTKISPHDRIVAPTKISLPKRLVAEGEVARAELEQRAVSAGLIRVSLQREVLVGVGVDGASWANGGEAMARNIQLAASKVEQCALAAMGEVDEVVRNVTELVSGGLYMGL